MATYGNNHVIAGEKYTWLGNGGVAMGSDGVLNKGFKSEDDRLSYADVPDRDVAGGVDFEDYEGVAGGDDVAGREHSQVVGGVYCS